MIDLSRASAPDDGVARRTILAGAAWSIPVIATATVAPAASASGTLALAFNQASYSGTACSTITGAYVTATNGGVPAAGVAVTVSLANGYTFAGGSVSASGTSDASGRISLPSINVPGVGGTATLTATGGSPSVTTTATATAAGSGAAWNVVGTGTPGKWQNPPTGSTVIGFNALVSPTGDLWVNDVKGPSNVNPNNAISQVSAGNANITYTDTSGVAWNVVGTGTPGKWQNPPTGSTVIGYNALVSPTGDLWINDVKVASNVDPNNAISQLSAGNANTTYTVPSC